MKMDKVLETLKEDYALRASLKRKHLKVQDELEDEIDDLEQSLITSKIIPELEQYAKTLLNDLECEVYLAIKKDSNGNVEVDDELSCIPVSIAKQQTPAHIFSQDEKGDVVDEVDSNDTFAKEPEVIEPEEVVDLEMRKPRSKSIGFAVSFSDGTVYHEKKAVNTWILSLKKIGLESICNNRSKHIAWHRVNGQDICIVERTETVRESDGRSPQTLVDGFYVITQLSNDQKAKDLLALGEYLPKLGIKVIWDDETQETTEKPVINEEASHWNYPIKEQFRSFLSKQKTEGTTNSYTSTLDNAVRQWINKEVDEHADSVFSYTSAEDVRLCIEMLNSSPEYVAENDRKHHSMSAALNQYLKFIEEWESKIKSRI